jgi:hypothetical protein
MLVLNVAKTFFGWNDAKCNFNSNVKLYYAVLSLYSDDVTFLYMQEAVV